MTHPINRLNRTKHAHIVYFLNFEYKNAGIQPFYLTKLALAQCLRSVLLFSNLFFFWDTLIQETVLKILKTNIFRGDLTDISAWKEPLLALDAKCTPVIYQQNQIECVWDTFILYIWSFVMKLDKFGSDVTYASATINTLAHTSGYVTAEISTGSPRILFIFVM